MSSLQLQKLRISVKAYESSILDTSCNKIVEAVKASGIESKVVSMPCQELFDKQPDAFKKDILDEDSLIVTIEAGNISSWNKYSGKEGLSLGIDRFGESAPYKEIYDHVNLSADKIVVAIQDRLRE